MRQSLSLIRGSNVVARFVLIFSLCLPQLLLLASALAQEKEEGESEKITVKEVEIEVPLGIDESLKFDFDIPRNGVQIGNNTLLEYTIIPTTKEVVLRGAKPGKTSVVIRDPSGKIRQRYLVEVTVNDKTKLVKDLRDFLEGVEGIDVGIKGDQVYVGGEIIVPSDIGLVNVILKKYPQVLNLVELSAQSQIIVARKMQEELQQFPGLKDVKVRVVNKVYWLEGIVGSSSLKEQAEKVAIAYLPGNIPTLAQRERAVEEVDASVIENFIAVNAQKKEAPVAKQVLVAAQFVELSKDYEKVFGFSWIPFLSGTGGEINIGRTAQGGLTTNQQNTLSATISNLFPKLNSAKSAGHARVLQKAILLLKDRTNGNITKSETVPFALGSGDFTRPQQAESTFTLNVTPTILEDEKIDLVLDITASFVDQNQNAPQTLSNSIKNNVIIKAKETAVIGGIFLKKKTTAYDKDPPGGQLNAEGGENVSSPLFNFIRSKAQKQNKSQFAIFVTPEVIESASYGTEDIKRKFRQRGR